MTVRSDCVWLVSALLCVSLAGQIDTAPAAVTGSNCAALTNTFN